MHGRVRNAALVAGSVALTLFALETWVRIRFESGALGELEERLAHGTPVPVDTPLGELAAGVVWSNLPGLVYEIRPNLRGTYDGSEFASNRLGFRHDHETRLTKKDDIYRLLGVGGDAMFGRGVNNGETYLDRLQAKLGAYSPGRVEVVNAAVWGYNAAQSVATVRWRAAALQPDVVVMDLAGDDREQPVVGGGIASGGSYLWRAVRRLFDSEQRDLVHQEDSAPVPFFALLDSFDELAHLAREHDFRVVVFSDCFPIEGVEQPPHCRLATAEQWQKWHHRNFTHWGFATCPWRWDLLPTEEVLPNAAGNRVLADHLYDCLMANRQLRPPLFMSETVEIGVDQPSLRLRGCDTSGPTATPARCDATAELVLRWLPAGERFRVSLRVAATPTEHIELGPVHAVRRVGITGGLATYPEPLIVGPSGELRLGLATGARGIAIQSLILTAQPPE